MPETGEPAVVQCIGCGNRTVAPERRNDKGGLWCLSCCEDDALDDAELIVAAHPKTAHGRSQRFWDDTTTLEQRQAAHDAAHRLAQHTMAVPGIARFQPLLDVVAVLVGPGVGSWGSMWDICGDADALHAQLVAAYEEIVGPVDRGEGPLPSVRPRPGP